MKIVANRRDTIRLIISVTAVAVGLLLVYGITLSQRNNPPPDANIGAGLIYLLGLAVAIAGGIGLLASLLYLLFRNATNRLWLARLLAVAITAGVALVGWYVFIGANAAQKATYREEIEGRYANFVAYQEPVKLGAVSGRQSSALTKAGNAASPTSATIDLHICTPGAAAVSDATGTTHFAFSGVKKDERTGMSDCILYIGREVAGQTWDQSLNAKCTWVISEELSYNIRSFTVSNNGIQLGDFLGNCQDLRTGRAPTDLSSDD